MTEPRIVQLTRREIEIALAEAAERKSGFTQPKGNRCEVAFKIHWWGEFAEAEVRFYDEPYDPKPPEATGGDLSP